MLYFVQNRHDPINLVSPFAELVEERIIMQYTQKSHRKMHL